MRARDPKGGAGGRSQGFRGEKIGAFDETDPGLSVPGRRRSRSGIIFTWKELDEAAGSIEADGFHPARLLVRRLFDGYLIDGAKLSNKI